MKHHLAVLISAALCTAFPTAAQERNEQHTIKDGEARTGSKFRDVAVRSGGIPFNLTYGQLTAEQKSQLKSAYESMGDDDEPPFPAAGLAPIMKEVHQAQKILRVRGDLRLHARVNAEGKVTTVAVAKSVDSRMDTYVAGILMRTKFKPAMCGGVACAQEYLFMTEFGVNY